MFKDTWQALVNGNGIARRLALSIILFSSVITLAITVLQLRDEYNTAVGQIDERFGEIGRTRLPQLIDSVWIMDETEVREELEGIAQIPDIEAARILIDAKPRWQSGRPQATRVLERRYPLERTYRNRPVTIGELEVVASLDAVYHHLRDRIVQILVGNAIKTTFVGFFILVMFQVMITRHVYDIAGFAEGQDPAGLTAPPYVLKRRRRAGHKPDVLDRLVRALNTMRSRLAEAYQEQSQAAARLRSFIEQAPAGIAMFDHEMRYLAASRRYRADLGLAEQDLAGRRRDDFVAQSPAMRAAFAEVQGGAVRHSEAEQVTLADGTSALVRWEARPWYVSPGVVGGIMLFREDITARRRAAAERRRWADVFANAGFGIAVSDPETGAIIAANPAYAAERGTLPEALAGTAMIDRFPPDHQARAREQWAAADRSGHVTFDAAQCRQDGSVFTAQLDVTSVADHAGRRRYHIVSSVDVTARELAEQARDQAEEQVRQVQKMEAIGHLTGGVAHDFNNLLGIIIGNLDLLLGQPDVDGTAREVARELLEAALMGADLTQRLLAFARRQPLRPTRIDANALLTEVAQLLRRTLGEDIDVVVDLAPELWPVVADPTQLHAALINLANNARDAMPAGGRLLIATTNRRLDAASEAARAGAPPGEYAVIVVSDTGPGVPAEHLERIFEPFFTTKEVGKGTGLGLSMVFGFIKQSGGHVDVRSSPGAGATFQLYLPRASQPQGQTAAREAAAAGGSGQTVLVVEDDAALRRTVLRQVRQLGYRALEADTPAAALQIIEDATVDLVLTDIVMPGPIDGVELARRVLERWPDIKVVLTSGFSATQIGDRIAALGVAIRVLAKPYRAAQLADLLREMFAR